jgi:hypothetical protein
MHADAFGGEYVQERVGRRCASFHTVSPPTPLLNAKEPGHAQGFLFDGRAVGTLRFHGLLNQCGPFSLALRRTFHPSEGVGSALGPHFFLPWGWERREGRLVFMPEATPTPPPGRVARYSPILPARGSGFFVGGPEGFRSCQAKPAPGYRNIRNTSLRNRIAPLRLSL